MPVLPIVERDLALTRGFDFDESFLWETSDGSPYNLTGWTGRGEVRPAPGDSHLIFAFDTDDSTPGTITIGGVDGTIALHVEREDTWDIPRGGVVEVWLFPPGDDVNPVRFLRGRLTVEPVSMARPPAVSA